MRNTQTKADGGGGGAGTLSAAEFNAYMVELENAVTGAGTTLDNAGGPDTSSVMLRQAALIYALCGHSYVDGGSANAVVLTAAQSGFTQPAALKDGLIVFFRKAATTTGGSTLNYAGLGAVAFVKPGNVALANGDITINQLVGARYFSTGNRWELLLNTTPPPVGAAEPDDFAVYLDSGTASQTTLSIVSGFVQPSTFTERLTLLWKANVTNDGVSTHPVSIASLGTKNLVEFDGTNPVAGRVPAGAWVLAAYRSVTDRLEIVSVTDLQQPPLVVPGVPATSSSTAYVVTTPPTQRKVLAYVDQMIVLFRAPATNSGALTLKLDALAAVGLRDIADVNYASGAVPSGVFVQAQYFAAQNRFRSFPMKAFPTVLDFQVPRSARITDINTSSIPHNSAIDLAWGNPEYDELNFYDPGEDSFVIPAGVTRVDISANIRATPTTDNQTLNGAIIVNGDSVVFQDSSAPAGVFGIMLHAPGIPVDEGDVVLVRMNKGAVAGGGTGAVPVQSGSWFHIAVSKFS